MKNCILESRKSGSSINSRVNICHLPQNFHFCMKVHVSAFYRCLSEGTYCSLTKQTECAQEDPVLIIPLSLHKHCNCLCTGKGTLIQFSFGHLGQWFIVGIVKHFVQCHIFVQSVPGQCTTDKYPVSTFYCSWFV